MPEFVGVQPIARLARLRSSAVNRPLISHATALVLQHASITAFSYLTPRTYRSRAM